MVAWERVRGHDAWIAAFQRAVRRGRLAHAYLFTGPMGVGKQLFAVELAKSLLCEAPNTKDRLEACDHCPACIQVEAGTHPDFYRAVRPAELHEFPIELMRDLCQRFALRSARGRGKVVLIDDADDLNDESANCFLKTLEEPPPRSVLMLIGSSVDRQLPTVVSRCQVVRFSPLPIEIVEQLLAEHGIDDVGLCTRLARLSDGSPGVARELADPLLWEFRSRLLEGLVQPSADTVGLSRLLMNFVEEAGKESAAQRGRARLVLRLLVGFLRDVLALEQGASNDRTKGKDALIQAMADRRLGTQSLLDSIERCLEADWQIERRGQLVLVLEGLLDALGRQSAAA